MNKGQKLNFMIYIYIENFKSRGPNPSEPLVLFLFVSSIYDNLVYHRSARETAIYIYIYIYIYMTWILIKK
jgi:hypothetical protein